MLLPVMTPQVNTTKASSVICILLTAKLYSQAADSCMIVQDLALRDCHMVILLLMYCYNCFQIKNSLFTTKSLRMHQKQSQTV